MCDTYTCGYLEHSTFRFNLIDFQLNTDFPSQFCVFFFVWLKTEVFIEM